MRRWTPVACACALLFGCGDPGAGEVADTETSGTTGGASTGGTDEGSGSSGVVEQDVDPDSIAEPWAARLSDVQYQHTVEDVFGIELTATELDALPPDIPTGRDYSTVVPTQSLTAQHVLAYAEVARELTGRLDLAALLSTHGGCDDATDPGCLEAFVRGLGLRLFRRPLTDGEVDRLLDLAEAIRAGEHGSEADVVPGIVQAMLQMPAFLYRIERETDGEAGEVRELDGYELATRLSYFLWLSAPDAELLAFAAGPQGDGVYDPQALPAEVERLLTDPKFRRARDMFWGDYTMASRSSFGTTDVQLAGELRDSLMLTLERLSGFGTVPRPLSDLFDGDELVMTPAVAELAGIDAPEDGPTIYDVAEAKRRLGVVTHPAFLASIGTTSFVGRGLFLSERLLCQHVAEPPADVAEEIENTAEATEDMTPREASEFRFGLEPACQVCHYQFEPVAYAFERYDIQGRYAKQDEMGRALYADGVLPVFGDRPEIVFEDAAELLSALSGIDPTQRCFVQNMYEFAAGQPPPIAGAWLDQTTAQFTEDGSTLDALVLVIALSDQLAHAKVVEPG